MSELSAKNSLKFPVFSLKFPANREFYREFVVFNREGIALGIAIFNISFKIPRKITGNLKSSIRELFLKNRDLNVINRELEYD